MLKKTLSFAVFFVIWVLLSVPVGGLVLAAKNALGINLFSHTGYHAFQACLTQEFQKATAP